jgi:hypothetical protein
MDNVKLELNSRPSAYRLNMLLYYGELDPKDYPMAIEVFTEKIAEWEAIKADEKIGNNPKAFANEWISILTKSRLMLMRAMDKATLEGDKTVKEVDYKEEYAKAQDEVKTAYKAWKKSQTDAQRKRNAIELRRWRELRDEMKRRLQKQKGEYVISDDLGEWMEEETYEAVITSCL